MRLNPLEWAPPLQISRNVTLAAHPTFIAISTYVTLDCASIPAAIAVQPGVQLTFRWLELTNYVADMGFAQLLLAPSPGSVVLYDNVVQRRRAGFTGRRNLADLQALPRPPGGAAGSLGGGGAGGGGPNGSQVAFYLPRFCYNASREASQICSPDVVYMVDVSSSLGPTSSPYFAADQPLGQYDMVVRDSVHAVDYLVNADCLEGGGERECVLTELRLLDRGPVSVTTRPADRNLVKIVASLAILTVAVLLFLYFRRHYRTYQQRRARRMRRMKAAMGMGPEAHGMMFNGLDGEDADWQIMPMPVGYAAEEDAQPELPLRQDSQLRHMIQDLSNRPKRTAPPEQQQQQEGAAGTEPQGAAEAEAEADVVEAARGRGQVRIELATAAAAAEGEAGTDPIAVEVGLLAGEETAGAGGSCGRGGPAHGSGSHRPAVEAETEAADAGGAAAAGPGAPFGRLRAGDVGTLGGLGRDSHRVGPDASGASFARAKAAAAATGRPTALRSCAAGCGGVDAVLGTSPRSVTSAGAAALLANRPAAAAAAAAGPIAAVLAATGCTPRSGSGGAAPSSTGPAAQGSGATQVGTGASPRAAPAAAAAAASPTAAAGSPRAEGAGGSGAARRGVTAPAAEARSEDADGGEPAAGEAEARKAQASTLLDELELLRREVMAGVSDTQLQIMSVVGSGAFGTVYRGQWQGLEVAVKTVVFSASSDNRKRALQEAALCQSINHRNIVATYAVDVQPLGAVGGGQLPGGQHARSSTLSSLLDWRLYIVQEYCDGGPLRKLVQSRYLQTESGPNMPVICEVALELAQALAHLHSKNIIHGDLNPNNVLLKRDPTSPIGFRVKMADFGLSVMVPIQKTHMSNLRLGTLYYIAPETCFRGQLGYAADVFSLGVMLWELYHGRLAGTRTAAGEPRYQPDFPDFPAACPLDYRKLAHRCLQKQPHNRLHSSQVVQRLQEMLAGYRGAAAAGPPAPLPPLPPGGPDVSVHGAAAAAAAAAAVTPAAAHSPRAAAGNAGLPAPQGAVAWAAGVGAVGGSGVAAVRQGGSPAQQRPTGPPEQPLAAAAPSGAVALAPAAGAAPPSQRSARLEISPAAELPSPAFAWPPRPLPPPAQQQQQQQQQAPRRPRWEPR